MPKRWEPPQRRLAEFCRTLGTAIEALGELIPRDEVRSFKFELS